MLYLVFILYALFGFTFTLGKITLQYAQPFFTIGLRMMISGIGLMSYIYLKRRIDCYPVLNDAKYYAQVAIFGIFVPYCSRAWALQYMSTTKMALFFNFMPFFTAFFAYFINKERLTLVKLLGLIIGFVGMIPILLNNTSVEQSFGSFAFVSFPECITIIAVASFSYNYLVMQTLIKERGCAPILANGISMLWGGILAFNLSLFTEYPFLKGSPLMFLGCLSLLILISNILCAHLQATLLKYYSSTFLAFANFLSPLWAAFYGWVLLGESITWHFIASLSLVSIGLGIYYYDEFRKKGLIARC